MKDDRTSSPPAAAHEPPGARWPRLVAALRRIPRGWRRGALGVLGLALYQLGASIAAPGFDGSALAAYFRARRAAGNGGLLALYDRLVGGGLSRGALLALGVMPYLSAWAFVRLSRHAFPAVARAAERPDGRRVLRRWTRVLTIVFALVQSLGYALFTQSVPGVVAEPGLGHVLRTMLVLTVGAIAVLWLGEALTGDTDDDEPTEERAGEPGAIDPSAERPALAAPPPDVEAVLRPRAERETVN
jgi:preprotein translocase subunit SecY